MSTGIRNTHRMAASVTLNASTLPTTTLPSPHPNSPIAPRSSRIIPDGDSDDDDQIVWNVTKNSDRVITSDEDFVVLAKSRSNLLTSAKDESVGQKTSVSAMKQLEEQMNTLSLSSKAVAKKKSKKSKRSKKTTASSSVQGIPASQKRKSKNSAGGALPSPVRSLKHADIPQVTPALFF